MLFAFIIWLVLSFVVASAARQRGRSPAGWFLLSVIASPLLAAVFLLLFPVLHAPATEQLSVDDAALQHAIRMGQADPHRGRRIQGWIVLAGVIGIAVAIATLGISNVAPTQTVEMTNPPRPENENKTTYATVASLPCAKFLDAYSTAQFSSLSEPLIETVSSRSDGLGSGINVISFVATECRLRETISVGQAVENLFDQKQRNQLPRIPIGGATTDPEVRASWDAFDKWIKHRGLRPTFPPVANASPITPAIRPLPGQYCDSVGKYVEERNQADRDFVSRLPPENPNSPKNPNYKPPYAWKLLSCDETNDPKRVGGMIDIGGGTPWYFEAPKSAYPFSSDRKDIRLSVCLGVIARGDDILAVPACRAAGQLRKICDTTPRLYNCDNAPDQRGCARRNAICTKELGGDAQPRVQGKRT